MPYDRKPIDLKPNTGMLFKRANATGNQPTYTGVADFEGTRLEISLWRRTSKAGNVYLSITLRREGDTSWRTKAQAERQQRDDNDEF